MSMIEWARREVEIACKKERELNNVPDSEWDYGASCYKSALKAYKSLCEDGHSGYSFALTRDILNRLMDRKPLTPIEDVNEIWDLVRKTDRCTVYQCQRMSSLFKDVYSDGTVNFYDNDRVVCVDLDNYSIKYNNGFISKIVNEMFPIVMPYMPENDLYEVFCRELLTDSKNGDFDTIFVAFIRKPDGDLITVDRFFKEGDNGWIEINKKEYNERIQMHLNRKKENKV